MPAMGDRPASLFTRLLPPSGLPRTLAFQSAVFAVGNGVYLTGSVVFFTLYVGLTPVQIGLGFSFVGLLSLVGSLPLGHLADRVGGKRAWVLGALAGAAAFGCSPFARSFWAFLIVLSAETIADILANAGRMVYTAAAIPAE